MFISSDNVTEIRTKYCCLGKPEGWRIVNPNQETINNIMEKFK